MCACVIHTHTHIHTHIYIYIERERDDIYTDICMIYLLSIYLSITCIYQ